MIAGRLPLLFEDLVAAHQPMVLRTACRLLGGLEDAKDAAQEVFLRLFKNGAHIAGDPKAWLYRVTVNVCNDHYRRRTISFELGPHNADTAPDPERILTMKERKSLLLQGLDYLTDRERTAVVLRDIEGLTTAEVSTIMGVEEVTVRTHIHGGRIKLAKYVRSRR